jgi:hypothetical protein
VKAHLIPSDVALKEGLTYTAACGVEVKNAEFPMLFLPGNKFFWESVNSIGTCKKCFEKIEGEKWKDDHCPRYVYGLRPGQEARDEP